MNMTLANTSVDSWLQSLLGLTADHAPFPWQLALFEKLREGEVVRALDIPTGLGKTSVMALWLAARACGANLPRRLVYVVDRRAVVDQATDVATALRGCVGENAELKQALGLEQDLPISTLRGQYVDNREWLADPTSPAIIVGTVDMVGSRLLFEGYGVSRRMRPYHAGLLGVDTLVVLDEAHLVPPFEKLLEAVADRPDLFGPKNEELRSLLPPFRLMSLSATGRHGSGEVFQLTEKDREAGTITRKRLDAKKCLSIHEVDDEKTLAASLARHAWDLSQSAGSPARCLVFANERKVAEAACSELEKLARAEKKGHLHVETELFVGGRRVYERQNASENLKRLGFIAGSKAERSVPTFLFATSAGEVGVDLDADHMVCDLVEWERMVQRLGRVNRRGEGEAQVRVLRAPSDAKKDPDGVRAARLDAVMSLFLQLPTESGGAIDASPGAIDALKKNTLAEELLQKATTPAPLHPPLTRPLVEAWSMTSLDEHTGRPEVGPWLRGWVENEEPRTTIIWREILPVDRDGSLLDGKSSESFFDAAKPHTAELLEVETWRATEWLRKRLAAVREHRKSTTEPSTPKSPLGGENDITLEVDSNHNARPLRADEVVAIILGENGKPFGIPLSLNLEEKRPTLEERLVGSTLVVDVRLGGLTAGDGGVTGLLDEKSDIASDVIAIPSGKPVVPIRVRRITSAGADTASDAEGDDRWRSEVQIPTHSTEEGEDEWILVESWPGGSAETEEARAVSAKRAQNLIEHQEWTESAARRIAQRLGLSEQHTQLLTRAARLHDEGKQSLRWQRAFGAPPKGGPFAKTIKRPNIQALGGYRHELGSLPYAELDPAIQALPLDLRALCLHMIAAHHGRARPLIPTAGADEPPSILEKRAREVASRFAALEKQWGPWGLAWWEALLRAADQEASRQNDGGGMDHG